METDFVALGGGALAVWGLSRRSLPGAVVAAIGSGVALGAVTARRTTPAEVRTQRTVTIAADPSQVYTFWRRLDDLGRAVEPFAHVTALDERRSRWELRGPLGAKIGWEAEIVEDRPGERLAWRATTGAGIAHDGAVIFAHAPGGRGTEVTVTMRYSAPAARTASTVSALFGRAPEQMLREGVRRVKNLIEAGEVPTVDGQPSARRESRR